MGQNYLTKYWCWNDLCNAVLDDAYEADVHCRRDDPVEFYVCEICGFETTHNTEAEMDCKHHK